MTKTPRITKDNLPTLEEMTMQLLAWHSLAVRWSGRDAALNWYEYAREEAVKLANDYGLTLHVACQVISALSPGKRWTSNLKDAELLIAASVDCPDFEALQLRLSGISFGVGYSWKNAKNAWLALHGIDISPESEKTFAFAHNLEFPDSMLVTIDLHMIHIMADTGERGSISPSCHYAKFAKALYETALVLGYQPKKFQALLWAYRVNAFESGLNVSDMYRLLESIKEI